MTTSVAKVAVGPLHLKYVKNKGAILPGEINADRCSNVSGLSVRELLVVASDA
jgi:hypothetical protein